MNQETGKKIIAIQQAAQDDQQYRELLTEYEPISKRFLEALESMTPEHRDVLVDYFGVTGAMHLRLLELAMEHTF